MYAFLSFLAYASLACIVLALWKPRIYPFKNPGRLKGAGFYLLAFLVFFFLSGIVEPGDKERGTLSLSELGDRAALSSKAIPWTVIEEKRVSMPASGRDRLQLTICPGEEQAGADQRALLAAATEAALRYQKESGLPVVMVNMICQKAEAALGAPLLAQVVYIPDGKGFDGVTEAGKEWETLRVATRGFSAAELQYMQLWASKYRLFQGASGLLAEELDAAVSAELGIRPGSLTPFDNVLEDAELEK